MNRYIDPSDYLTYRVTGVTVSGERFRMNVDNLMQAWGINLYRGSVWGVRRDGTRKLLKRVYN